MIYYTDDITPMIYYTEKKKKKKKVVAPSFETIVSALYADSTDTYRPLAAFRNAI